MSGRFGLSISLPLFLREFHRFLFASAALLFAIPAFAVDTPEQPVGLILSAPNSKLVRLNSETPLAARAGDLLFAGDTLRTEASAASFLFCPANAVETLTPAGEVRFEAKAPKVKTGKLSEQAARSCSLPKVLRVAVASGQHYGVRMVRGGDQDAGAPVTRANLPPQDPDSNSSI